MNTWTSEVMELYRLPGLLQAEGNLDDNWKTFRQEFDIYMMASEKNWKSKEIQAAILLNLVGDYGRKLFNDFKMTDEDKKDVDKILEEFERFCVPKKNVVLERFKFNQRCQQEGENFNQFLEAIQNLICSCEYGIDEMDNILRDRIVAGISDLSLREKLLSRNDVLDCKSAIDWCRSAEATKSKANKVEGKGTYLLAVFVRRMDYVIENRQVNPNRNGYGVYGTLHHELKKIDSKKFIGVWRREACGNCNEVNCQCTFPWPRFMTTVLALCEETTETLELFATQAAEGTHSLTIHRYADLKDGKTIAEKIKRYAVIQKLTRNAEDWNSQYCGLEMVDAEYGGSLGSIDAKIPKLPPAFP